MSFNIKLYTCLAKEELRAMQNLRLAEYIDQSAKGTEKHLIRINKENFQNWDRRPLQIFYQPKLFTLYWGHWGNALKKGVKYKDDIFESQKNILRDEAQTFTSNVLDVKSISMDIVVECGDLEMEYKSFKFNHPVPNTSYMGLYTTNDRRRYGGITLTLPTIKELQQLCVEDGSEESLKVTEIYQLLDEDQHVIGIFNRKLNITLDTLNQCRNMHYNINRSVDIHGLETKSLHITDKFGKEFKLKTNQIMLSRIPIIYIDFAYMYGLPFENDLQGPVVVSEYSKYLQSEESNKYLDLFERSIDHRYFNLLIHLLIANFNLAADIEPGNQFSEVNVDENISKLHLGTTLNNWQTHRKETSFFKSKQNSNQNRWYDIEVEIDK